MRGFDMHYFGRRLKARRNELGLSLADVGVIAGVTRQHVQLVEVGKCAPSLDVAGRIAVALELRLTDLLPPIPDGPRWEPST